MISGKLRNGNAAQAKDAAIFLDGVLGRMRETVGASTKIVLRADSGFYTENVIEACRNNNMSFTVTIRQLATIRELIEGINEDDYQPVIQTGDKHLDVAALDNHLIRAGPQALPFRVSRPAELESARLLA
ncbi:MAG: hypothetical protein BMS9Abin20_0513 [Acidimicrobiia bacterium]|nr:MAG: hypothetical protein BMS9Abin20_0513 [Acidimicrobiia bacterium]